MKLKDIASSIEQIAPLSLAQSWDNVGLLIGDPEQDIKNILLTIDITNAVVTEAKKLKTNLIISYHPVIWDGLKKITAEPPVKLGAKYLAPRSTRGLVYELIRCGIAVYSIHTALDSAIGGTNDGLAEIIGIQDGRPIGDYVDYSTVNNYKLVVFIPVESIDKVTSAIYEAGAGAIGNYSNCGFMAEGTGTFLPLEGAKPSIGTKGKFEKVNEVRFETIVPAEKLDEVITAMKKTHPYETPAFDVYKLYNNYKRYGLGRIGKLSQPLFVGQIIKRIKKHTGASAFGSVGNQKRLIKTAAVCAGSCGDIINLVITAKVDLYVTGELKHHQALAAQEADLSCICLSHSVSERFILRKLAKQLQNCLKQVTIKISKKDKDPFIWKNI